MADKNILGQMLEHLVNNEKDKAEELFHEYVVARSRDIYEGLIENEIAEEEDKEEDEEVDEAAEKDEDESDEDLDENFEDIAYEGDDEEGDDMMGGDPTDDLEGELDAEMDDEEGGEKSEEELFMDLESIVDELQAKFDELKGDDMGGDDMGDLGDDEQMKDEFDLATVREYVEKVPAGHGAEKKGAAEKADNTKSLIDNMKNDMGGTTANILSSKEDAATYANQGQLKGSGLLKGTPKEDNAGNINTPGAKNGNAFSKKEPGHGAEKAGAKESADNKQSLFRGRR
jgi:hypothetical protein